MNPQTPCPSGKARLRDAAPRSFWPVALSAALILPTLISPALAARPHKKPARPRSSGVATPLTPFVPGRSTPPVQTLLVRNDLAPVGTSNGVRLWLLGDRSGADVRVRVLAPVKGDGMPRDEWISEPIPISFAGWREFVLPQAKFTLRAAPVLPSGMDMALPADAQPAGDAAGGTPDWSAANGLALDVTTSRQTRLGVDDVAWVTLDASGQGASDTVATDFETGNVGAWKPGGTHEGNDAVVYGVTTQPGQVHGGRVAFRLTVTPPGLVRSGQMPSVRDAMAASGHPYLVWTPASLFARVLPDSLPPAVGTSPEVNLTACPEQTEAATFCLYSPRALRNVIVSLPQDLQGIGHTIPRTNVELHVVKVLAQGGSGSLRDADTAGPAPALLVKDDRQALSGPAPAVRLTGPAVCDVPADTSKQFWVTVTVPRGTLSNNYIGRMLVSSRDLPAPISVRLVLSVLPLRLLSPAKQYGIDLRSRLDPAPVPLPSADGRQLVTDFVTKDVLDRQLADIAAHGFNIASLYDSSATLFDAITEYRNYGLGSSYNLYKGDGDPQAMEKQRSDENQKRLAGAGIGTAETPRPVQIPALTYYTDPDPNAAALSRMGQLTKAGIPNATYVPHQADFDALGADTDIAIYGRDSEYPQKLLLNGGKRISQTRDWWYWPAASESPKINRADSGLLLWRANLYGAYLPDYQTAFGADPYDEASAGAAPSRTAFRPLMLTYPARDGVLDTLQWEACREGVNDVRYLTTMYDNLRQCKDAHIAKPLVGEAEGYVKAFLNKPLANLPETQYDTFRAQVANYAMLLRKALDAASKVPVAPAP